MRGVVDLYVFSNKNASKHSPTTIVSYQTIEKFWVHIWAQCASVFLGLHLREFAKTITKWLGYYRLNLWNIIKNNKSHTCVLWFAWCGFTNSNCLFNFGYNQKDTGQVFEIRKWNCFVKQQSIMKRMLLKLEICSFWSHLIRENPL